MLPLRVYVRDWTITCVRIKNGGTQIWKMYGSFSAIETDAVPLFSTESVWDSFVANIPTMFLSFGQQFRKFKFCSVVILPHRFIMWMKVRWHRTS